MPTAEHDHIYEVRDRRKLNILEMTARGLDLNKVYYVTDWCTFPECNEFTYAENEIVLRIHRGPKIVTD